MWKQALFITACVVLPVVWGIVVNMLFNFWSSHKGDDDDSIFPDYQI